jgi:endonuclease YncB( thermonuclease family)
MSIVMIISRRSARTQEKLEEATGRLRRIRSSERALILEFDWGDLRVEPDADQYERIRKVLSDSIGQDIAVFRVSDGRFLVRPL